MFWEGIYQTEKARGVFSFCESIAEGQHNNSNFLWLCCLAMLHAPLHCWQSTNVCSSLLKGLHKATTKIYAVVSYS